MLKLIHFERFRGYKSFQANTEAVTVFLGPNSSGKTTALHAVRLACELLNTAVHSKRPARIQKRNGKDWISVATGLVLNDVTKLLPLADWKTLFVDRSVGAGVSIQFTLRFQSSDPVQELWVELACAQNQQVKISVKALAKGALDKVAHLKKGSKYVNIHLTKYLKEHAPLAILVPPFYGVVKEEEFRAKAVVDRLIGSGDQSHAVRNLISQLTSEQFTRLNAFLDDTVGARLTYRTTGDATETESPLVVKFRDSNGDIEISAGGAGLVNLAALYASLSRWKDESKRRPVIFLLDEPEAHLHPRLQGESAARLARLVTQEYGAQLFLATHSVSILNRLSESGACLLRCDRNAQESVVSLDSNAKLFEDLGGWVDLTPYTAINFLASRKVLFVEGRFESQVLPQLAKLRWRNDPKRLAAFHQWSIVELESASNHKMAGLLSRLVSSDAIRAQAKDNVFQVVLVLDRDFERIPGLSAPIKKNNVSQTTLVWEQHSIESIFMTVGVLSAWVRAFVGDNAPENLSDIVQTALDDANVDEALNENARDQLTAKLISGQMKKEDGDVLHGDQKVVNALKRARKLAKDDPATWQRGKDRSKFVLRQIRAHIPLPKQNSFSTDLGKLIKKTDINKFPDSIAPLPVQLNSLFDKMVP